STYFFYQAEDGIRDATVTGVQTCALPIYRGGSAGSAGRCAARSGRSFGPEHGKEDDVADVRLVREDHQQPVESQSDAAGGRHAVLERPDEVLVQLLCLRVARGAQPRLLPEAAPLLLGIVQLAERVGELALLD